MIESMSYIGQTWTFTKIEIDRKIGDLTHLREYAESLALIKLKTYTPCFHEYHITVGQLVLPFKYPCGCLCLCCQCLVFFPRWEENKVPLIIWSCGPNFHTSQTWPIFSIKGKIKNIPQPKFTDRSSSLKRPRLHSSQILSSAGFLTLHVVRLYSTPCCSAVTSLHTGCILHPSDKHALMHHCVCRY